MAGRPKNFRRRFDDEEAGDDDAAGGKSKPSPAAAKPTKPPPPKPKLLSFADDEDGDGGGSASHRRQSKTKASSRLSKTPASAHKLTSSKDRGSSPVTVAPPSNVQPQAGEYTAEKLRELQKNTRTLASSKSAEPVIVLRGLVKPAHPPPPPPPPLPAEEEEAENERGGAESNLHDERDDAEKRLSSMGLGNGGKEESLGSLIPDQATIDAIRAKRERLRQSRAVPDYISLDSGSGGRLSDDDGDFHGRIALLGEKSLEEGKGVFEGVGVEVRLEKKYQVVEEDEEEDEEKKWEEEQFRKGLGKRVDDGGNVGNGVAVAAGQSFIGPLAPVQGVQVPLRHDQSNSSGSVGEHMSIAEQAEAAVKTLYENLRRLRDSYSKAESSVVAVEERLKHSCSNITDLEKAKSEADEKFIFMQKVKNFVTVVCELLEEKAPYIEELEEQKQKIHRERALAITDRRATDEKDEMPEIELAINAAKSILSRSSSEAAMAANAALAAAREHSNVPIEYDEYGRDKSGEKQSRARSRQRRQARAELRRREASASGGEQPIEGELSTDESDSESYNSSQSELLEAAEGVFRNVADEYSTLSSVKKRFEEFKKFYLASYRDAYTSMSVPMIFSYYVRLELLRWDPLHEVVDFNDMQWHSLLFNYGVTEDDGYSTNDPDWNLVPQLVEKVAIPILHHYIVHCWDILSTRATRNAVSAINMIINYFPDTTSISGLQNLFGAIRSRLSDAVDNLTVPTWDTKLIQAVPTAAQTAAYKFGVSVRLLRNICLWKDILSQQILEELAVDGLLVGKVLPHLQNLEPHIHDAVGRTERIVASLSNVWPGSSGKGDSSRKVQPLVNYLMRLMNVVNAKHKIGGIDEDEIRGLARRLKAMLVQLNEYDKAKLILKTFHLKEAI